MPRTKMTELTSEISRLTREVEAASEEQGTCLVTKNLFENNIITVKTYSGTYLAYDKRVKELAAELTTAQVGTYNFCSRA